MNCRTKRFMKGVGKYYSGGIMSYQEPANRLKLPVTQQNYNPITKLNTTGIETISTTGSVYNVDSEAGTKYGDGTSIGQAKGFDKTSGRVDYGTTDPAKIDMNLQNSLKSIRDKMEADVKAGLTPTQIYSKYKSQGVAYTKGPNGEFNFNIKLPGRPEPFAIYTAKLDTSSNTKSVPPSVKTLEEPIEPYTFTPRPKMSSTMIQNKMERITTPPGVEVPKPEFPNVKDRDSNVPSQVPQDRGFTFKRTSSGGDTVTVYDKAGIPVKNMREEDAIKEYGLNFSATNKRGTFGSGKRK